ncbi:MAG: toxin-antitoxin system YwqK family antitoxin, partial [Saprospiraceae bacterium]
MEFSRQGQIILLCNYENNQLEGKFARYRLGRTTEEGAYKNGKLHGNYKKYYDGKSIVQQEANYTDGELDGKTLFYNEKGDIIVEYTYKMGQKIEGGIVEKGK